MFLLCLLAACASRHKAEPERYVVTTDVTHWIRALETDDLFETEPAVEGLTALGPSVIPVLERALEREPASVRVGVVEVLGNLQVPETLPALLRAARDPEAEVRAGAVSALGELKDERGREAVEAALGDPDTSVAGAAARACKKICRSPHAMEALVQHAMAGLGVAGQSVVAILHGGTAEQSAAARAAVSMLAGQAMEKELNAENRVRAALLLVEASPERALPTLRDYAANGSDPLLRALAIRALSAFGTQGDSEMLDELRKGTAGSSAGQSACRRLGRTGGEKAGVSKK